MNDSTTLIIILLAIWYSIPFLLLSLISDCDGMDWLEILQRLACLLFWFTLGPIMAGALVFALFLVFSAIHEYAISVWRF